MSGIRYDTIWKHCEGMRSISAEMALRYETTLKIPRSELRPDLWSDEDGCDKHQTSHIAESKIVRPSAEKES